MPSRLKIEELPYGLRVAQDCHHLEEDPVEMDALQTIMEMIVQDATLTRIAQELNRRGFPTRDGAKWSPLSVYQIFPRLIEVTPRIFGDADWKDTPAGHDARHLELLRGSVLITKPLPVLERGPIS